MEIESCRLAFEIVPIKVTSVAQALVGAAMWTRTSPMLHQLDWNVASAINQSLTFLHSQLP